MTREQKLALIIGFALVLSVGVLVSDHFSAASNNESLTSDQIENGFEPGALSLQPDLLVRRPNMGGFDGPAGGANPEQAVGLVAGSTEPEARPIEQESIARNIWDGIGEQFDRTRDGIENLPGAQRTTRVNDQDEERSTGPGEFIIDPRQGRQLEIKQADRRPARIYEVRANDSLWGIAQREYGDGALHKKLAAYNFDRVAADGTIRSGASLLIPTREVLLAWREGDARDVARADGRRAPERAATAPASAPAPAKSQRTYTVKKDETLSEIAKAQLGSARKWRDIVKANDGDIPENGSVREGQVIVLPPRE